MIITVHSLSITSIGDPRSCEGALTLLLFRPDAETPCVSRPVHLGPISEDATLSLGFRLDATRCGNASVRLSATLSVECRAGWLQRWWRQTGIVQREIAEGEQVLDVKNLGQKVEVILRVPQGVSLVGQRNMESDPDIDSDLGRPRLALDAGEPNGLLTLTLS